MTSDPGRAADAAAPSVALPMEELSIRQPIAVPIFAAGCTLLVVGSSGLAAMNLLHFVTLSPRTGVSVVSAVSSGIWLAVVFLCVREGWKEEGWRRMLVGLLGLFSRRHFVRIEAEGDRRVLADGYRMFGLRFYNLRLDVRGITELDWHTGQASAMTGRDCDDWSVFLHFKTDALLSPRRNSATRLGGRAVRTDLHCIGHAGPHAATNCIGLQLVEMLRKAGAVMEPKEDARGFRQPRPATSPA